VIVTSSVGIYNDFVGPLYFLPGNENVTVQLTLFSFMSRFCSQWNLLFAEVLVTIRFGSGKRDNQMLRVLPRKTHGRRKTK
jgi:hypothetical protein